MNHNHKEKHMDHAIRPRRDNEREQNDNQGETQ